MHIFSYFLQIPLPDSVTGRYAHTISSFVVDPNHVFLVIVGGGIGKKENGEVTVIPVTDHAITMVVELGNNQMLYI